MSCYFKSTKFFEDERDRNVSRKQERKEAKRRMDYLANEFRFLFCERREREKNSFFEEGLKYGGYVT